MTKQETSQADDVRQGEKRGMNKLLAISLGIAAITMVILVVGFSN